MMSITKTFTQLVVGAVLLAAPVRSALAQPAESGAPPTVDPGTATQRTAPIDEGMHGGESPEHSAKFEDPTRHFRFLGSPFSHNGHDEYGGKLGDDKMVDPATGEVERDEHGQAYEEPMSAPFIFMLLNFGILFAILAWKGGPWLGSVARDRHDQIKSALDEAAKLREQAAAKLAQYEARLKDADSEIKKMVDGMRADAEADKQRILEAAQRQSAQMKRDSELRIAAEIELARARLMREVTVAATSATEKLLIANVNHADQAKLVSAFIADLGAGRIPATAGGSPAATPTPGAV